MISLAKGRRSHSSSGDASSQGPSKWKRDSGNSSSLKVPAKEGASNKQGPGEAEHIDLQGLTVAGGQPYLQCSACSQEVAAESAGPSQGCRSAGEVDRRKRWREVTVSSKWWSEELA